MERFLPEREQRPRKPHQPPRWAGLGPSSRFGGRVRNAPAAAPARASRTLAARGQWAAGRLNLHGGRGESGRLTVTRKCDNPERWLSPTRGGPSLSAAARLCPAQGPGARTQRPAQRTHSPRRGCPTSPHVDARGSRRPRPPPSPPRHWWGADLECVRRAWARRRTTATPLPARSPAARDKWPPLTRPLAPPRRDVSPGCRHPRAALFPGEGARHVSDDRRPAIPSVHSPLASPKPPGARRCVLAHARPVIEKQQRPQENPTPGGSWCRS